MGQNEHFSLFFFPLHSLLWSGDAPWSRRGALGSGRRTRGDSRRDAGEIWSHLEQREVDTIISTQRLRRDQRIVGGESKNTFFLSNYSAKQATFSFKNFLSLNELSRAIIIIITIARSLWLYSLQITQDCMRLTLSHFNGWREGGPQGSFSWGGRQGWVTRPIQVTVTYLEVDETIGLMKGKHQNV